MQVLTLLERYAREDAALARHPSSRRRSAEQYSRARKAQFAYGVMARALHFLRLSDTSRLPIERTTLAGLLTKWGGVVRTKAQGCAICNKRAPPPRAQDLEEPALLDSKVLRVRHAQLDLDKLQVRLANLSKPSGCTTYTAPASCGCSREGRPPVCCLQMEDRRCDS